MSETTGRVERKITMSAAGKRMTFRELRDFVQAAMQADVPDDTEIGARVSFSGHLNKIETQ
jgi:hypothetical protein